MPKAAGAQAVRETRSKMGSAARPSVKGRSGGTDSGLQSVPRKATQCA